MKKSILVVLIIACLFVTLASAEEYEINIAERQKKISETYQELIKKQDAIRNELLMLAGESRMLGKLAEKKEVEKKKKGKKE